MGFIGLTRYLHVHLINLGAQLEAGQISERDYDIAIVKALRTANFDSAVAIFALVRPHLVEALNTNYPPFYELHDQPDLARQARHDEL